MIGEGGDALVVWGWRRAGAPPHHPHGGGGGAGDHRH